MPETKTAFLPCDECSIGQPHHVAVLHRYIGERDVRSPDPKEKQRLYAQLIYRCDAGHERIWGTEP